MAPDKLSQKERENKTVPPAKANKTAEAENLEMFRDLAAQLEGQGDSNKAPSNAGKTQRIPKKMGRTATVTSTGHRSPLSRIDEQNEWEEDFAYDPAMTAMTMGMGFLPYLPQFFPPPHAGFGAPMTTADPDEPEEGDAEIETEDDLGSPEPVDQDGEGTPEGDLLSVVRERYVDEDGPPVETELAGIANTIWRRGWDPSVLKNILSKYQRPANVDCHKVDLNPEILVRLPKVIKSRDMKLQSVQSSVARASVPAIHIAEAMIEHKDVPKKDLVRMSMDTLTLLADVNDNINQIRRDFLRPSLQPRFQAMCQAPKDENTTKLLFEENMANRVKAQNQIGKITKRYMPGAATAAAYTPRGRGYYGHLQSYPQQPYPFYPGYGYQPQPYMGRGRGQSGYQGYGGKTISAKEPKLLYTCLGEIPGQNNNHEFETEDMTSHSRLNLTPCPFSSTEN